MEVDSDAGAMKPKDDGAKDGAKEPAKVTRMEVSEMLPPEKFRDSLFEYPNEHDVYLSRVQNGGYKALPRDTQGRFIVESGQMAGRKTRVSWERLNNVGTDSSEIFLSFFLEVGVTVGIYEKNVQGVENGLFQESLLPGEPGKSLWRHYPIKVESVAALHLKFHQCYAYDLINKAEVENDDKGNVRSCGALENVCFNQDCLFVCNPEPFAELELRIAPAKTVPATASSSSSTDQF